MEFFPGQQECSEVGAEVLKEGGNAVDSAIATLLCQGVVEPYFSGIGGLLFFLHMFYNEVVYINCMTKRYFGWSRNKALQTVEVLFVDIKS